MFAQFPAIHRIAAAFIGLTLLVVLRLGGLTLASATEVQGSVVHLSRPMMGTVLEVSIWAPNGMEPGASEAALNALNQAASIERLISSWDEHSETSAVNQASGTASVPVGPVLEQLLSESLEWARITGGAFDCTGGPLFELWEQARISQETPVAAQIRDRMELVGHQKVEIEGGQVRLTTAGMKLGFGAVGKGFAADRVAQSLRAAGFPDFIIDAGGDLLIGGTRGNAPWNVAVRHPRRKSHLATIQATDGAITTSGDYERFFEVDGERYSHIVDLRSGHPATGLASVTVLAPTGLAADALATGLSVMGAEAGLTLVNTLPDVEALLVAEDGTVHLSTGLQLEDGHLRQTR